MAARRKLISIGHSYVVALNRRLAHEMARAGGARWEVTAVSPTLFKGRRDLRAVEFERIADEPCAVETIPARFTGRIHGFYYGRQLKKLLSDSWDAVHCWEEPYIFAGAQVARWTPRESALIYFTFQNLSKKYPWPFSAVERYSMRRADGWVSAGTTITQALGGRAGYADRPMRMIPIGVDVEHFHPDPSAGAAVRASLGWKTDGPAVVGYLGRFNPEKGLTTLMGALDSIKTPWRALFVGAGPMEGELRAWGERYGDRVKVCNNVRHDGVAAHLNAMDMLCAPSRTTANWREQFGRMLSESFACGVPVIGSDSGEIPYVLDQAGVVVSEHDQAAWAKEIERLLLSTERRAELGHLGRARACERFAWPAVARQYLEFFDELVEKKRR